MLLPAILLADAAAGVSPPPARRVPAARRVIVVVAPPGHWAGDVRRVAARWNRGGLPALLRVVTRAARADVRVVSGHVSRRCGGAAFGCVLPAAGGEALVLPGEGAHPVFPPGTGPQTLIAHEFGHVLGLGHRGAPCTVMRARLAACAGAPVARTRLAPGCRLAGDRGWRCPRQDVALELCGPAPADIALARWLAGLPARAWRPELCAGAISPRLSRAAEAARQSAGLRAAIAGSIGALWRAAARRDPRMRRWCAGLGRGPRPAVARALCRAAAQAAAAPV